MLIPYYFLMQSRQQHRLQELSSVAPVPQMLGSLQQDVHIDSPARGAGHQVRTSTATTCVQDSTGELAIMLVYAQCMPTTIRAPMDVTGLGAAS
jgi:hypothetical protein